MQHLRTHIALPGWRAEDLLLALATLTGAVEGGRSRRRGGRGAAAHRSGWGVARLALAEWVLLPIEQPLVAGRGLEPLWN